MIASNLRLVLQRRSPSLCLKISRNLSASTQIHQEKVKSTRQQMQETYAKATSFQISQEEEMREIIEKLKMKSTESLKNKWQILQSVTKNGKLLDAQRWMDFTPQDLENLCKNIVLGMSELRDNGYAVVAMQQTTGKSLQDRLTFMTEMVSSWSASTNQTPTPQTFAYLMQHANLETVQSFYQQYLSTPDGQRLKNSQFASEKMTTAVDSELVIPTQVLVEKLVLEGKVSEAQQIIDSIKDSNPFVQHSLTVDLYASVINGLMEASQVQEAKSLLEKLCQNTHIDIKTLNNILDSNQTIIHYPTKLPSVKNELLPPPPQSALLPFLESFAKQGKYQQFESLFHNLTPYFLTSPNDRAWYLRSLVHIEAAKQNPQEAQTLAKIAYDNMIRCLRNGSHITKQTIYQVAMPSFAMLDKISQFVRLGQSLEVNIPTMMKGLFQEPRVQEEFANMFLNHPKGVSQALFDTLDHIEQGETYMAPNGKVKTKPCTVHITSKIAIDNGKAIDIQTRPAVISNVLSGLCRLDKISEAEQLLQACKTYHPLDGVPGQLPPMLPEAIPPGKKFRWLSTPFSNMFGSLMMYHASKTLPGQKALADGTFSELSHDSNAPHVTDENLTGLPRVLQLFDDMQSHGLRPTTTSFNAMAISFIKAGDISAALQIYEVMKGAQVIVDSVTKAWMDWLVKNDKASESIVEAWKKLEEEHIAADENILKILE